MVYYFIMELYYVYYVSINYARFQFILNIDLGKYIETKVLFLVILLFSFYISATSAFIYSVFVFFIVFFLVPGLITYSHQNQIAGPLYSIILLLIAIGVISTRAVKLPVFRARPFSYGLIITLIILALFPIIFHYGFFLNINNLFLEDVYDTRTLFDKNRNPLLGYLYPWLVNAVIPLFFVFFLIKKKHVYALLLFSMLIYLYVISGNKIVYVTSVVMTFFYFIGKGFLEKTQYFVYALVIGLLILPLIDYYILESNTLKGTFVMRMLFLPSQINFLYFDFFENKHLFFAESHIFNWFFEYPYNKPIGFIISETYFDASDMNSNNGIISDGFMNLGYYGVALNILIISSTFLFFNSLRPDPRYLGAFFVMIFLFLSVPMLSMFLTSGLWLTFLIGLAIMKQQSINS